MRTCGTPQGGVISPLLANLFLHYAFDIWMRRSHPRIQFERYADDVICHCYSQREAQALKKSLEARFLACHLMLHPEKTHVVYCRDSNRRCSFEEIQFDFLGFAFRPRCAKNRWGKLFTTFIPAVSPSSLKKMRDRIRGWSMRHHSHMSLEDIAECSIRFCGAGGSIMAASIRRRCGIRAPREIGFRRVGLSFET